MQRRRWGWLRFGPALGGLMVATLASSAASHWPVSRRTYFTRHRVRLGSRRHGHTSTAANVAVRPSQRHHNPPVPASANGSGQVR